MSARVLSVSRSGDRLAERRRRSRRRLAVLSTILGIVFLGALVYGLNQSTVRISAVEVYGADPSLAAYATSAMQGSYVGLIPRDSIFFFPEETIRASVLAANRDILALSIFRKGLTALSIKVDKRVAVGRWCGLAPTAGVEPYCYLFDANGLVYAAAASTTETVNTAALYAPLAGDTEEPLLATIAGADMLPATFDFARQLAGLGSPAVDIVIRDGEVTLFLASGTRIRYVLGNEPNAFTALVSAKDSLNLSDGSVEYVDLRFDGKVYLKRKE